MTNSVSRIKNKSNEFVTMFGFPKMGITNCNNIITEFDCTFNLIQTKSKLALKSQETLGTFE